MTPDPNLAAAREKGAEARREGKPLESRPGLPPSNPYAAGSPQWHEWQRGWRDERDGL
jgi:hypothetical protein